MNPENQTDRITDLFRRERRRLIAYVRRWIADTAARDGEDIVQDVVLNLFNKADVSLPIENLTAYVYQALRNRAIDFLRKKRTDVVALEDEPLRDTNLTLADFLPDSRYRADSALDSKERRQRLFRAIESLNDNDKAVLIETEFEGRSFRELSEQWNIPVGTLLARKSRALQKIKIALDDAKVQGGGQARGMDVPGKRTDGRKKKTASGNKFNPTGNSNKENVKWQ